MKPKVIARRGDGEYLVLTEDNEDNPLWAKAFVLDARGPKERWRRGEEAWMGQLTKDPPWREVTATDGQVAEWEEMGLLNVDTLVRLPDEE